MYVGSGKICEIVCFITIVDNKVRSVIIRNGFVKERQKGKIAAIPV